MSGSIQAAKINSGVPTTALNTTYFLPPLM